VLQAYPALLPAALGSQLLLPMAHTAFTLLLGIKTVLQHDLQLALLLLAAMMRPASCCRSRCCCCCCCCWFLDAPMLARCN
jgi:hypothetical protein